MQAMTPVVEDWVRGPRSNGCGCIAAGVLALSLKDRRLRRRRSRFTQASRQRDFVVKRIHATNYACGPESCSPLSRSPLSSSMRRRRRAAGRGGAVHEPGLLLLSAGRRLSGRAGAPPWRDRARPADRLLGLPGLEGYARAGRLQRPPARLCKRAEATADLYPSDGGERGPPQSARIGRRWSGASPARVVRRCRST